MTGVVNGFQNVLLYNKTPDLKLLIYPAILGVITVIVGLFLFKRASSEMADVL